MNSKPWLAKIFLCKCQDLNELNLRQITVFYRSFCDFGLNLQPSSRKYCSYQFSVTHILNSVVWFFFLLDSCLKSNIRYMTHRWPGKFITYRNESFTLNIYVFIKIYMIYSFDKRNCISEYSQSRNDMMPASCISTLSGIGNTPNKNGLKWYLINIIRYKNEWLLNQYCWNLVIYKWLSVLNWNQNQITEKWVNRFDNIYIIWKNERLK